MVQEKEFTQFQPLTAEEIQLLKKVDENRDLLIQLTQDLVKIDSRIYDAVTYSSMDEIFRYVENFMQKSGMKIEKFPCPFPYLGPNGEKNLTYPNLIAWLKGQKPGPTLQFMGHLDIVPYTSEKWKPDIPPLGGIVKGDRIYGRGSADMKSGVACMMLAMRLFKEANLHQQGTLQLYFPPDEEIGAPYGACFMAREHLSAIKADATIISEPTCESPLMSPAIIIGEKGPQWYHLRFIGASGHGSAPKQKSNALNKAIRFMSTAKKIPFPRIKPPLNLLYLIQSLLGRYSFSDLLKKFKMKPEERDPRSEDKISLGYFFNTTLSFNQIAAGSKVNVIPDVCDLDVDIRILPGITTQQVIDALVTHAAKLGYHMEVPTGFTNCQANNQKISTRPVDIQLNPIVQVHGTFENPHSSFVNLLGNAFEAVYHTKRVLFFAPGATDAAHLRNHGLQDIVILGPGGANAHDANEYVEISHMIQCTKIYLLTAYRFLVKN